MNEHPALVPSSPCTVDSFDKMVVHSPTYSWDAEHSVPGQGERKRSTWDVPSKGGWA
jgi:hypothetical protein